jgi:protoporphyrinogen oxidase
MKKIIIIGGGVAGLSSAVFLAGKGYEIELFESSPKLGGRCYSFYNEKTGYFIDNGKHLIAGWYKNFIEFLRLTDSINNFKFQDKFKVSFLNKNGKTSTIYISSSVLKLFFQFTKSDIFSISDLFPFYRLLKNVENKNLKKQDLNAYEFIAGLGFSGNTINLFWETVSLSIFNTKLKNVTKGIFSEVIRRGFNDNRSYLLGFPETDFYNAFIKNAESFLAKHNIKINRNNALTKINIAEGSISDIETENSGILKADYYILAVPFFAYKNIFREDIYEKYFSPFRNIKTSPIINLHLFFKERIPPELTGYLSSMLGFHNPLLQWLFVNSERHVNITISGADEIFYKNTALIKHDKSMLFDIVLNELKLYIKCLSRNDIEDFIVIKEKRATYMPDFESVELKKINRKLFKNMLIAGDWTNEYLPSTLESAALSGRICAGEIINTIE